MSRRSSQLTGRLIVTVILIGFVSLIIWLITRPRPGQTIATQGNRHLDSLTEPHDPYNSKPPTSGPHVGAKAPWGISDKQIPDELQIHNLEDRGVIIHYDPAQTTTGTIQQLADIVKPLYLKDKSVILEPYANLDAPIVLTAWTKIDKLAAFDQLRIEQFIDAYEGIDHHAPGR